MIPIIRRRKFILIPLLVFLVIIIFEELHLQLYNSKVTSVSATTWSDLTGRIKKSQDPEDSLRSTDNGLKGRRLLIYCLGYEYDGKNGPKGGLPITVSIDHIDHGTLWIPLYKSTRFHLVLPLARSLTAYRQVGDSVQFHTYQLRGTITLNGELTINGICSRRQAERLLANHVMVNVYNIIRARLDEMK